MRKKLKNAVRSDIIKNNIKIEFKTDQKIKAKNQRHGNIKNQNTERKKPSLPKE